MPKGFFLQNPVYMTDLSSLLLRVRTTSLRDQTRKRGYPIGGVATDMLEKAEPMGMVCELHTSRHAEAAL